MEMTIWLLLHLCENTENGIYIAAFLASFSAKQAAYIDPYM